MRAANAAIFVHLLGAFQVWMQPLYGMSCTALSSLCSSLPVACCPIPGHMQISKACKYPAFGPQALVYVRIFEGVLLIA